jgi:hypothetical protein
MAFIMQTRKEKIRQRRAQMLVHSYFYYVDDDPLVDDDTWQRWANELAELGFEKIGYYDRAFHYWDGSSGAYLPLRDDPYVVNLANYVRKISQPKTSTGLEEFMS